MKEGWIGGKEQSPKIDPHMCDQSAFDTAARGIQWTKDSFFQQGALEQLVILSEKRNLDPHLANLTPNGSQT